MPRSSIKILDTVVFGIPRSLSSSCCQLLILVDCSPYMFNILRPSRTWVPFNRFSTTFEAFVLYFYLRCTECSTKAFCAIVPKSLLNYLHGFLRGMFKLNAKFDADSLLHSLSHFVCDGHTIHMLTQWRLLPPLTRTVKSSLFTHAHSSPLSLAARLHQCCANHSCYSNNSWTFSGQTVCVSMCVC